MILKFQNNTDMAQQKKNQLREFLRQKLDAGETSALKWTNKDKFEFRLEWKHKKDTAADGRGEDAIFREWAKHKGNDSKEITKLKENFRKAIQKSPFVEELTKDKTLGYKICRLKYDTEAGGQEITIEPAQTTKTLSAADNRRLRATYEDLTPLLTPPCPMEVCCPSITDLEKGLDVNMELELNSEEWQELYEDFEASQPQDMIMEECGARRPASGQETQVYNGSYSVPQGFHETQELQEPITLPSDLTTGHYHRIDFRKRVRPDGSVRLGVHDIFLLIKHRRCVLNRCHIEDERGFKISYLKPNEHDSFERLRAESITPDIHPFSDVEDAHVTRARNILDAMSQGLYIFADDKGNIHAVRISSLEIFYTNTIHRGSQGSPEILPKDQDVIVFSRETYRKAFEHWLEKKGPKPDVRVLFSVDEKWSLADPHDKCAISVTIASAQLLFQKKQWDPWWKSNIGPVPGGQLKQSEFVNNAVARQF